MNVTIIPVGMLGTNCYLLASKEGGCAVIDPGAQPDKIASVLEEKGLTPRLVLLTHGHHDHIGGLGRLRERYPDLPVYIGEGDIEMLEQPEKVYGGGRGMDLEKLKITGTLPLVDGQEIALDELRITVLETPGHTKGGVCFLCGDAMFSGDTLFRDDIGRCDLYGGDYAVMKRSLKKLAELQGEYTVYPGHGESTSLDHERAHNYYINE